jgi:sialic acid synthase SpsE
LLEDLDIPAYKIPSGELTNLPLLRHIGSKGRTLILSTGMADLAEVESAVRTLEESGNREIVLLHCVSNYPAKPEDVNLRAMETIRNTFGYNVGFSDHTLGVEVALAAVAMGACLLEKHFTLDRSLPGPDHRASLEPQELISLVDGIRKVETALGSGEKVPAQSEADTARAVRKSLVAACHIPVGTVITEDMLVIRRPGTGISPSRIDKILGRRTTVDIEESQVLTEEMVQ